MSELKEAHYPGKVQQKPEFDDAQLIACQAYQVIGYLADEANVFRDKEVQRALSYFSELTGGKLHPDEKFLPFALSRHI